MVLLLVCQNCAKYLSIGNFDPEERLCMMGGVIVLSYSPIVVMEGYLQRVGVGGVCRDRLITMRYVCCPKVCIVGWLQVDKSGSGIWDDGVKLDIQVVE